MVAGASEALENTDPAVPRLAIRNVVKTFPGVRAVDGVSLEVRRGEVHALIGENGAGKSTLMHLVAGVYQPDSGTIELDGTSIAGLDEQAPPMPASPWSSRSAAWSAP